MKSSLEQTEDSLNTTLECKKLHIKENNHLFNHIDNLAADHDVIVTNTMIKITYKKTLKDQNASESFVEHQMETNSQGKKNKPTSNEISFLGKSPKQPVFHSTPKQPPSETEKKKKYLNGLNLTPKPNNLEGKKNCTSHKVQKVSERDGGKFKNSGKRFLKEDDLTKSKPSISRKSNGEKKNMKGSDKNVKKKTNIDKKKSKIAGVKRKASSSEFNPLTKCKKIKISETEWKEVNGKSDVENKSPGKRAIMLVDPDLPAGWSRLIRTKNEGSANEQHIVYVVNPQGKKFRYKWKLRQYLHKTNSTLDPEQFFFGLYPRQKTNSNFERHENEPESPKEPSVHENEEKQDESSNYAKNSEGKALLLYDPDLPIGWKRIIHLNSGTGKKQVHIVSPDGKVFRRRYLLNEYLIKNQSNYDLNKFYFGLYPKREGHPENSAKKTGDKTLDSIKIVKAGTVSKPLGNAIIIKKNKSTDSNSIKDSIPSPAMLEDPNLPEGWKRFVKVRSFGESAGKMEVFIISPDGRKHRSKKHLKHYLLQKQLKYKVEDFDFTLFGKSNMKKRSPEPEAEVSPEPEASDVSFWSAKKKFPDKPVPELDISSLKDEVITAEGHMINAVSGLMLCSGLSSARNERRQRLPRTEHETQLKRHFSLEVDPLFDGGCEIPTFWIERLAKCRAEFRSLESDAVSAIAKTTKEFIKTLSFHAFHAFVNSEEPETGLKYEHVAEVVDRTECLSILKSLIPKKITFKEYIKLNRPKQFMSFT